jgi:hypothetical protein
VTIITVVGCRSCGFVVDYVGCFFQKAGWSFGFLREHDGVSRRSYVVLVDLWPSPLWNVIYHLKWI